MPPTGNMADLPQNGMENARAWDGGKMSRIGLGWPKKWASLRQNWLFYISKGIDKSFPEMHFLLN